MLANSDQTFSSVVHRTGLHTVDKVEFAYAYVFHESSPLHSNIQAMLSDLSDEDGSFDPASGDSPSVFVVPPGSVTHPHVDGSVSHESHFHVAGVKVWLMWPPTVENMKLLDSFGVLKAPTLSAIASKLKGGVCAVVREEDMLTLPSCWIHAVGTIVKAVHVSFRIVYWKSLSDNVDTLLKNAKSATDSEERTGKVSSRFVELYKESLEGEVSKRFAKKVKTWNRKLVELCKNDEA